MGADDVGMKQAKAEDWRAEMSGGEGQEEAGGSGLVSWQAGKQVRSGVLERETTVKKTTN